MARATDAICERSPRVFLNGGGARTPCIDSAAQPARGGATVATSDRSSVASSHGGGARTPCRQRALHTPRHVLRRDLVALRAGELDSREVLARSCINPAASAALPSCKRSPSVELDWRRSRTPCPDSVRASRRGTWHDAKPNAILAEEYERMVLPPGIDTPRQRAARTRPSNRTSGLSQIAVRTVADSPTGSRTKSPRNTRRVLASDKASTPFAVVRMARVPSRSTKHTLHLRAFREPFGLVQHGEP